MQFHVLLRPPESPPGHVPETTFAAIQQELLEHRNRLEVLLREEDGAARVTPKDGQQRLVPLYRVECSREAYERLRQENLPFIEQIIEGGSGRITAF